MKKIEKEEIDGIYSNVFPLFSQTSLVCRYCLFAEQWARQSWSHAMPSMTLLTSLSRHVAKLVFALIFGLIFFPDVRNSVISGRCCSHCCSSTLSTRTAAQTAGMTLWCQKWLVDRRSAEALANLMQTQLNDAAIPRLFFANGTRSISPVAGCEK